MKFNFDKILDLFKNHSSDIILAIGVFLISLFSFALGYIVAKQETRKPLKIEYESSYHWSWHNWSLFELETFRKRT